ncbi:tetratricopeptide repeat protein [Polaribacter sp. Asnod1-A03]|uniref:tetratricopeptide repeat protein n=1 Tax=Polaribacter sp. Asnod1-A03 TaxID=3160581 RepID=UPI00386DE20C
MKKKILFVFLFGFLKVGAQTPAFSTVDSLFEKGRYQLALSKLKQIEEPSFLLNFKTAVIYESIDDYKNTILFLEKALSIKDDYKAKLKLAKAYQRIKKPDKSIEIYEGILAQDSLNLVLKYQLGKLYLTTKKGDKAIGVFKKLIKQDSLNAHYSYQLGMGYGLNKDRNRMINSFLDTYAKDSTHFNAILRLATSFNTLKEIDSTKIFVEKGLQIDSNHVALNKLKINQFYRDKKYLDAIPLLLKLDTISRNDTYPTSMLGRTYYNLDSLDKAKKYFSKLKFMDRENFKPFTYLGHIAVKEKNYKMAEISYRMATYIGKEKRDEEYFGMATMYYETKKPKEAIVNFEKAYRENYNNYKALFQLAKLSDDYYKDKKIAYRHYKKYIERFESKDKTMTSLVEKRLKEIKKDYFLRGETLE